MSQSTFDGARRLAAALERLKAEWFRWFVRGQLVGVVLAGRAVLRAWWRQ